MLLETSLHVIWYFYPHPRRRRTRREKPIDSFAKIDMCNQGLPPLVPALS